MSILRSAFRIDAERSADARHHVYAALGMIALSLVVTGIAWLTLPLCPEFLYGVCAPFALMRVLALGLVFGVPSLIIVVPLAVKLSKDRLDGYVPAIVTGFLVSFFAAFATAGFKDLPLELLWVFSIFGVTYALLYWIVLYLQLSQMDKLS